MAKCIVTGKCVKFGNKVSHSHRRSNRAFKANLQKVKVIIDGKPQRVYVSTKALRSGLVQRAI